MFVAHWQLSCGQRRSKIYLSCRLSDLLDRKGDTWYICIEVISLGNKSWATCKWNSIPFLVRCDIMGKIPFAFCWPVMCPTCLNQFSVLCITHVKRRISGFRISFMCVGTTYSFDRTCLTENRGKLKARVYQYTINDIIQPGPVLNTQSPRIMR